MTKSTLGIGQGDSTIGGPDKLLPLHTGKTRDREYPTKHLITQTLLSHTTTRRTTVTSRNVAADQAVVNYVDKSGSNTSKAA